MAEATTNQTVHDPVCHMDILIAEAAGSSEHNGLTYYFCSVGCKVDFDEDPEAILKAEAEYDHSQPVDHGMTMGSQATAGPPGASEPARAAAPSVETGRKKPWWQFWK